MENRIILVDADIISHFIKAGEILYLPKIFKSPIKVLDKVYGELEKWRSKKSEVDNLIRFGLIEVIDFPETNLEIKKEFYYLKKSRFMGEGESACLAVARFSHNIVGSSNLKDIKIYCGLHSIDYVTTMDFLYRALEKKIFSEERCDVFLSKMDRLPVKHIKKFKPRDISHIL